MRNTLTIEQHGKGFSTITVSDDLLAIMLAGAVMWKVTKTPGADRKGISYSVDVAEEIIAEVKKRGETP